MLTPASERAFIVSSKTPSAPHVMPRNAPGAKLSARNPIRQYPPSCVGATAQPELSSAPNAASRVMYGMSLPIITAASAPFPNASRNAFSIRSPRSRPACGIYAMSSPSHAATFAPSSGGWYATRSAYPPKQSRPSVCPASRL